MFFCFLSLVLCEFSQDQAFSFSAQAPWNQAPLFDQMIMFIGERWPAICRDFLKVCSLSPSSIDDDAFLWAEIKKLVPIESLKLFKALLDTNYLLPRLEMYRECVRAMEGANYPNVVVAGESPQFAYPGPFHEGRVPPSYGFEIKFGNKKTFVYANMHDAETLKFVVSLVEQNAEFYLRPTGFGGEGTALRGFGVEMRPVEDENAYESRGESGVIREERHLRFCDGYLEWFKEELPADDPLDMATVDQIPERLGTLIKKYESVKLPELMRDVSNNWPIFKQVLSTTVPSVEAVDDVSDFKELMQDVKQGMSVNGRHINLQSLDIFSLLEVMQEEQTVRDVFRQVLGVKSDEIFHCQLSEDPSILLDFRGEHVYWINDLEKDPQYATWSTDVFELQQPQQGIPRVKKNLVNLVMYIDPSTPAGLFQLYTGYAMVQQGMPMRIGFVPYFNLGNRLSRKVAFAFHHISVLNPKEATSFLVTAFAICGIDRTTQKMNNLTEKHFSEAYNRIRMKLLEWKDLYKSYSPGSIEYFRLNNAHHYFKLCGVQLNTMALNGKVMSATTGLQTVAVQMQHMLRTVAQLCLKNGITDLTGVDVVELLSKRYLIVSTIEPSVSDRAVKSTGVPRMSFTKQREFIELFDGIEWCYTDQQSELTSFYIIFGENNDVFNEFMEKQHSSPTAFAKNPEKLRAFLGIGENDTVLIANGRVFYGLNISNQTQLRVIDRWTKEFVVQHVERLAEYLPTITAKAYLSMLVVEWYERGVTRTQSIPELWESKSMFVYSSKRDELMPVELILDPFSQLFQRCIDFFHYFDSNRLFDVKVALAVPETVNDLDGTLKCFYRYLMSGDSLMFSRMNDELIYSAQTVAPLTWSLDRVKEMVNIDCIDLTQIGSGVCSCEFVLSNLVIEGTCMARGKPMSTGLEIGVVDVHGKHYGRTCAIATSGYFQLMVNPGVFHLELTSDISKKFYTMIDSRFSIFTFARREHIASVAVKDPNFQFDDVSYKNSSRIDVFTIPSGPINERLAQAMMVSVKRTSQGPVKFWIMKTWLSPSFKSRLSSLAAKYGFEYEFINYQWPGWMRQQLKKDRMVAASKVLFLDVLFPLNLSRVIYVDPSAIVRTDLSELTRMNFDSAPYAFAPVCESRPEAEPHRFWRHGFWEEITRTKDYHNSALFAVDLQHFRLMNAGDWLRIMYQQLTADRSALAHLDQDLVNFVQERVPIFTLPQDWVWNQAWCSNQTFSRAKTIDLATDPVTNETGFQLARQLPDWVEIDSELQNL